MPVVEITGPTEGEIRYRRYMAMKRCEASRHANAAWMRIPKRNGEYNIGFWCPDCDKAVDLKMFNNPEIRGTWAPKEWAIRKFGSLEKLPILEREGFYGFCFCCDAIGPVEYHHVAAQCIYGDLAHKMPVVALCKNCHQQFTDSLMEYRQNIKSQCQ